MTDADTVRIRDLCQQDRKTLDPREREDLTFVGLEHVFSGDGAISLGDGSRTGQRKSTAFYFDQNHVLYGKLRPYLNKVALPRFAGCCSTELIPLRAREGVDREFLAALLRRQETIDAVMAASTGSRMPRADMNVLLGLPTKIPPLAEQRRIVDILNRAHGIRRLRREAQEKARQVIPALFVTFFGDPISNSHGWTIYPLGSLVRRFVGGKNLEAGSGKSPYRILRVSAVTSGTLRPEESKPAPDLHEPSQEHFVSNGDLLFSRANTQDLVGATAIAGSCPPNVLLPDKIWRIQWEPDAPILPEYALGFFQNNCVRQTLGAMSSGTSASMKNISQKKLKNLGVPIPPLNLQEEFASRARSMVTLSTHYAHQSETADRLADTLGHRMFC